MWRLRFYSKYRVSRTYAPELGEGSGGGGGRLGLGRPEEGLDYIMAFTGAGRKRNTHIRRGEGELGGKLDSVSAEPKQKPS